MIVSSQTILRLGFSSVAFLLVVPVGADTGGKVFRAGAATSNITGDLGMTIVGGILPMVTTHVHDELHARCLALDNGDIQLVFVVCDSCMIPRTVFDDAKRLVNDATGVPPENMLLATTHTHSATAADWCHLTGRPDPGYQRFLTHRIADGMRRALKNLEPARVGWGSGLEPRHVFNRRWFVTEAVRMTNPVHGQKDLVRMNPAPGGRDLIRPAGPVDPEVGVLSLMAINGRPIAVLANYSLHYVGGMAAGEISADYFGAFAENLKNRLCGATQDPSFVGIMSNGTSGDVNNINFFQSSPPPKAPYEQIQIVANDLARVTEQTVRKIKYHDWVPLAVKQAEVSLAVRKGSDAELVRARDIVARMKDAPALGGFPPDWRERETLDLSTYPDRVSLILQAVQVGDLGITAAPCEIFAEIGLELKAKNPFKPSFTICLANGYNGYLPTAQQHEWGGYETWRAKSSYLEVNAAEKITVALLDLLGQLQR